MDNANVFNGIKYYALFGKSPYQNSVFIVNIFNCVVFLQCCYYFYLEMVLGKIILLFVVFYC